jgi:hypothetical protein
MVLTAMNIPNSAKSEYISCPKEASRPLVDFYQFFGYFSGLLFIKSEMDPTTLLRTAVLVHLLDAILCCVIANHSGRNKTAWTVAGLLGGIWALGILFLLPAKNSAKI